VAHFDQRALCGLHGFLPKLSSETCRQPAGLHCSNFLRVPAFERLRAMRGPPLIVAPARAPRSAIAQTSAITCAICGRPSARAAPADRPRRPPASPAKFRSLGSNSRQKHCASCEQPNRQVRGINFCQRLTNRRAHVPSSRSGAEDVQLLLVSAHRACAPGWCSCRSAMCGHTSGRGREC
jgi:hypothetical protein